MIRTEGLIRDVRRMTDEHALREASDREVLARFNTHHDEGAFAELLRRHGPMVFNVCWRVLRQTADAEDAFQAVFVVLLRKAATLREPGQLSPWLHGVAWRVAQKHRQQRRSQAALVEELPTRTDESTDEVDAVLAQLPEKYRVPLVLCYLQGLSIAEAAGHLQCSPATLHTWLHRGRELLRIRLVKRGYVLPATLFGTAATVPTTLAEQVLAFFGADTFPRTVAMLADAYFRRMTMRSLCWIGSLSVVLGVTSVGMMRMPAEGQERPPVEPPPPKKIVAAPTPILPAQTTNFLVVAPSHRIANLIAESAERSRKDLAIKWFGKDRPHWAKPVKIVVKIEANASGSTTFQYPPMAKEFNASMELRGELDVILTDLLAHEVMHCLLADHFAKPLPRWADEGIALLAESSESRDRHRRMAHYQAEGVTQIPLTELLPAKDYPAKLGTFFAQSFSLCEMLVQRKDKATLLQFIADGMKDNGIASWEKAAQKHYGFANLKEMETVWLRLAQLPKPDPLLNPPTNHLVVFGYAKFTGEKRYIVEHPVQVWRRVNIPLRFSDHEEVLIPGTPPVTKTVTQVADSYQPQLYYKVESVQEDDFEAIDPSGKAIPVEKLHERLMDRKPVILADMQYNLAADFVKLLQPDTIVLKLKIRLAQPVAPTPNVPMVEPAVKIGR